MNQPLVEEPEYLEVLIAAWGSGSEQYRILMGVENQVTIGGRIMYYARGKENAKALHRRFEQAKQAVSNQGATLVDSISWFTSPAKMYGLEMDVLFHGKAYKADTTLLPESTPNFKLFHYFEGSAGIPWNILQDTKEWDAAKLAEFEEELDDINELPIANLKLKITDVATGEVTYGEFDQEDIDRWELERFMGPDFNTDL